MYKLQVAQFMLWILDNIVTSNIAYRVVRVSSLVVPRPGEYPVTSHPPIAGDSVLFKFAICLKTFQRHRWLPTWKCSSCLESLLIRRRNWRLNNWINKCVYYGLLLHFHVKYIHLSFYPSDHCLKITFAIDFAMLGLEF